MPQLILVSHNFGFGFVITWTVIMGTRGRSWALRVTGLSCAFQSTCIIDQPDHQIQQCHVCFIETRIYLRLSEICGI